MQFADDVPFIFQYTEGEAVSLRGTALIVLISWMNNQEKNDT